MKTTLQIAKELLDKNRNGSYEKWIENTMDALVEYAMIANKNFGQPDVSGNEANQSSNKKDGEVAVAFADWIGKHYPSNRAIKDKNTRLWLRPLLAEDYNEVTTQEAFEIYEREKAKATDR